MSKYPTDPRWPNVAPHLTTVDLGGHVRGHSDAQIRYELARADALAATERTLHRIGNPRCYWREDQIRVTETSPGLALLLPEPTYGPRTNPRPDGSLGSMPITPRLSQAWELERQADAILSAFDDDGTYHAWSERETMHAAHQALPWAPTRDDVWNRDTASLQVRPDPSMAPLLMRGKARLNARQQRGYTIRTAPKHDTVVTDASGCKVHCLAIEYGPAMATTRLVGVRGWNGHRVTVVHAEHTGSKPVRATRQAARATTGATGKRGPAVGPFSLSARSLPACVKRVRKSDPTLALRAARLLAWCERVSVSDAAGDVLYPYGYGIGPAVLVDRDGLVWELGDDGDPRFGPMLATEYATRAALAGRDLAHVLRPE